jgi:diguanylate cyclase (GGDEF)-like protein
MLLKDELFKMIQFMRDRRLFWGCIFVLAAGVFFVGLISGSARTQTNAVWHSYLANVQTSLSAESRQTDQSLDSIYDSIRTISFLPAVRNMQKGDRQLGVDGAETIQQIYNNLVSNIEVSELYLIPADFDPAKLDPETGLLQRPQMMFDHFITQRSQESGSISERIRQFGGYNIPNYDGEPEFELDEYRHMVQQISWFRARYPETNSIRGKNVPIIATEQLITCDNTVFNHTHKDLDRSGIVLSLPYYGGDGHFRGIVSAVIRTAAIRALQSRPAYSLTSFSDGFSSNEHPGFESSGFDWEPSILSLGTDTRFFMKERVFSHDPRGGWMLQRSYSAADFYATQEFISIQVFAFRSAILIVFATCMVIAQFAMIILHRATHDPLTGLPNRVFLEEQIEELISTGKNGQVGTLLYLDLDRFKIINDTLGHHAGDHVLKVSAERMLKSVRNGDIVARIGGDEFVILLSAISAPGNAAGLAERLIQNISEGILVDGREVFIGTSIGIKMIEEVGGNVQELLRHADLALFRSKESGRGSYCFYELEMDSEREEQRILEGDLANARSKGQLSLHYQPIVNLANGAIESYEVLVRWNHPVFGSISPQKFIPMAEATEQIVPIGEWVLDQACRDSVNLPQHCRIALNLSVVQLRNPSFPLRVVAALNNSGLSPHRIEFEITESVFVDKNDVALAALQQLQSLGVRIVLDDFGVGYSSFACLKNFGFDSIKIDRSFLVDIDQPEQVSILRAIIDLCRNLHMTTTIEGIETEAQLEIVRDQGCDGVQGYYFSKPMPIDDLMQKGRPDLLSA